jgi:hypothetical protein
MHAMSATLSMRCAFCRRVTHNPAAYIGQYPVGPKCAQRHNMADVIKHQRGAVRNPSAERGHRSIARRDGRTMDLFEGTAP